MDENTLVVRIPEKKRRYRGFGGRPRPASRGRGADPVRLRFHPPCRDCRFCWSHLGCSIRDAMQEIYPYWEECDNVVLASPIWFSSLSGPLLSLASRFQTQFAARHFRNEPVGIKQKNGVILLVGAESGTEAVPIQTACTILKWMQVRRPCSTVCSLDTNRLPAAQNERALSEARLAAERLNELYRKEGQGPHF